MGMGKRRQQQRQADLWIPTASIVRSPGHAFYTKLEALLRREDFDAYVEGLCASYYKGARGRPSLPPGVYFRCLLIGYFEGLDAERGIAWRVADSLSLRQFLGYGIDQLTPDHSTISRTRRLFALETHQQVFQWVLRVLKAEGLLTGKTLGIDATTLEANAAMRSIVRRETGETYREYLTGLAQAEGIAEPTREELARVDRKRKKTTTNAEGVNPVDPDARVTKLKDGRTHFAYKAEHAVDLETGALLAITVQPGDAGDTTSLFDTLGEADDNATAVELGLIAEVVADRGYHSGAVVTELTEVLLRTYVAEPRRPRRRWKGKANGREEQRAVYANRRRLRSRRNAKLQAKRAELNERSNAHLYETGGMRRVYLRGRANVAKRLVLHAAAFDLGLVMRKRYGVGTPRGVTWRAIVVSAMLAVLSGVRHWLLNPIQRIGTAVWAFLTPIAPPDRGHFSRIRDRTSTTGC
jgi:transposase